MSVQHDRQARRFKVVESLDTYFPLSLCDLGCFVFETSGYDSKTP